MYFDITSETLYLVFSSVAEKELREFLDELANGDDRELAEVIKEVQPHLSNEEVREALRNPIVVALLREIRILKSKDYCDELMDEEMEYKARNHVGKPLNEDIEN
jgi:phosphoenolpyruvate synthase/pyruvate phosphate dikinase